MSEDTSSRALSARCLSRFQQVYLVLSLVLSLALSLALSLVLVISGSMTISLSLVKSSSAQPTAQPPIQPPAQPSSPNASSHPSAQAESSAHITLWEVSASAELDEQIPKDTYTGWLGARLTRARIDDHAGRARVLYRVAKLHAGGPAAVAGFTQGDLLYQIAGHPAKSSYFNRVNNAKPQAEIQFTLLRERQIDIDAMSPGEVISVKLGRWSKLARTIKRYLENWPELRVDYRQLDRAASQSLWSSLIAEDGALSCESAGRALKQAPLPERAQDSQDVVIFPHPQGVLVALVGGPSLCLTHKERAKIRYPADARGLIKRLIFTNPSTAP